MQGKARVDGFDVGWDLVGGVQRNRFRGNFSAEAELHLPDSDVRCLYDGYFSTKRR